MEKISRQLQLNSNRLITVKDEYTAIRDDFETFIEDGYSHLRARISRYGNCTAAAVVGFYNATNVTIAETTLRVSVQSGSEGTWSTVTPTNYSSTAAVFSQAVDVGNTPLTFALPNTFTGTVPNIEPGKTGSLMFTFKVNTNENVRICVERVGYPGSSMVCASTAFACVSSVPVTTTVQPTVCWVVEDFMWDDVCEWDDLELWAEAAP